MKNAAKKQNRQPEIEVSGWRLEFAISLSGSFPAQGAGTLERKIRDRPGSLTLSRV